MRYGYDFRDTFVSEKTTGGLFSYVKVVYNNHKELSFSSYPHWICKAMQERQIVFSPSNIMVYNSEEDFFTVKEGAYIVLMKDVLVKFSKTEFKKVFD